MLHILPPDLAVFLAWTLAVTSGGAALKRLDDWLHVRATISRRLAR